MCRLILLVLSCRGSKRGLNCCISSIHVGSLLYGITGLLIKSLSAIASFEGDKTFLYIGRQNFEQLQLNMLLFITKLYYFNNI